MIIQIVRWDINPDKVQAYEAWAQAAVPRLAAIAGPIKLGAYRPIIGSSQVVTLYEFADLTAWAMWSTNAEVQAITSERRAFTLNEISELWGESPIVPEPVHSLK